MRAGTSPRQPLGIARWSLSSVLLALLVCALLAWLHMAQRQMLGAAVSRLENIRQARLDLAKGFLHTCMAAERGSPFGRDDGVALLHQAIATLEREVANGQQVATAELARSFRHRMAEFESILTAWRRDPQAPPRTPVALRIAYSDLERQAGRVDAQVQEELRALASGADSQFRYALGGSAAALLLMVGLVILAARRQAVSLALRKQTEQALRESQARLLHAQRLAGVGNWEWDLRTGRHTWSEEIYRIYGRDPTLPPANYEEVQGYFVPESWARLSAAVEQGLAEGLPYECDAEVLRADGTRRWITACGEALRDADGKLVGLHGTVHDITERKSAEEQVHRLNTDLERRVAERTAELIAANHELDAFAYAVSHDLRAPLRAMSGFSQALVEDYGGQLAGEAKAFLAQIDLASRKMSALVDGLLVLSSSTRSELRRDTVNLSALAERLLAELAQKEPERRVTVAVEGGITARGDARMLESVMRNLLDNAWKYTAQTAAPRIRVYAEYRDDRRRCCVADNGAGFDMAYAQHLFQPFQRLHRQDEFPGLGIGLATVQRIVHRHGGDIEAHGETGRGATFCFTLPDAHRADEGS